MLYIDNTGKVVSPSYSINDLHREAKKHGLNNYSENPYPHYKVKKKNILDVKGKNGIEVKKPKEIRYYGKRQN